MVMVFLRCGNLFLRGLEIYLSAEESFQAVLKYLFSTFFNLPSNSIMIQFFSYICAPSSPFYMRYDSSNSSTL